MVNFSVLFKECKGKNARPVCLFPVKGARHRTSFPSRGREASVLVSSEGHKAHRTSFPSGGREASVLFSCERRKAQD